MTDIPVDEARDALRRFSEQIRASEKRLRDQINEAADAEAVYRKALAVKYAEHRAGGAAVTECELRARADVVSLSRDRDAARDNVRACLEEIDNRRGERSAFQSLMRHARPDTGSAP